MDTNKEKPDKAAVYHPEDRELMLSLLKEYSEKLIDICQQIENSKKNNLLLISDYSNRTVLSFIILFFLVILTLIFVSIYMANNNHVPPHITDKIYELYSSINLLFIFVLLMYFLYVYYRTMVQKKQEFLKHSTKTIALKLAKIIRAASQIDEHIETSFAKRIEWDLRLTDAESALEYYELVTGVNRKKKP